MHAHGMSIVAAAAAAAAAAVAETAHEHVADAADASAGSLAGLLAVAVASECASECSDCSLHVLSCENASTPMELNVEMLLDDELTSHANGETKSSNATDFGS